MFRRAKNYDAGEKFLGRAPGGRGQEPDEPDQRAHDAGDLADSVQADDPVAVPDGDGPFDSADVDRDGLAASGHYVDLGSLLLRVPDGAELRLPISEEDQRVLGALLVLPGSAVELSVFAAPRSGGLWKQVAEEIAENAIAAGGSAERVDQPHGLELRLTVPGDDGVRQQQRLLGFDGPRWMLRVNVVGVAGEGDIGLEEIRSMLAGIVVTRGSGPMAPREPLPLALPAGLTPLEEPTDD
jgi:hypothetical protein